MTLFAPSSYQELGVMLHDALDLCTGPAAIRWSKTAAPSVPDDEVGSGLVGPQGPRGPRRVHPRRRQDARRRPGRRRGAGRRGHRGHRVGRAGGARSTRRCSPTPPSTRWCSPPRTASATAASARSSPTRSPAATARPQVRVLGTPTEYIPHGKPDQILADLGLDAAGLAREARRLVAPSRLSSTAP